MRYRVGAVDEFAVGAWKLVHVDGRELGVYNRGDRLFAVRNRCPHEGAPLCLEALRGTMVPSAPGTYTSGLEGRVLTCPWHGWEFDIETGKMVFGTGEARLRRYPVEIEDRAVFVVLDERERVKEVRA